MPARTGERPQAALRRPAAMCLGPAHGIVYGNPAFIEQYGPMNVGLPAREVLVDLPGPAFQLLDRVRAEARPLACWLIRDGLAGRWRLTAAPRVTPDGEVYGVSLHLRAASDVPIRDAGR